MNTPAPDLRLQNAREWLRGYPPGTLEAAEDFFLDRGATALDRLVDGVLMHFLPPRPERPPFAQIDPTAHLVRDLGLDSIAMVELTYLLDVVVGLKFSDDELRGIVTLGDLHRAVQQKRASR